MTLPTGYETLIYRGHFRVTEDLDYSDAILSTSYGGGYRVDEIVFPALRACSLSYPTLHKDAMILVSEDPDVFVSRHDYLWDFYKARKDAGNEPFLMKSPKDGAWFLWIFSDSKLSYELIDLYMAASSVKLQQVNVRGVTADNADGSFDEE
jgi:hypothetical protein